MSRRISPSLAVLFGWLGATALSPASAQTTSPAPAPAVSTAAPAASQTPAPPSVLIVTGTPAKPQSNTDQKAQNASDASDREAFFEAHLAALHAGLMLTSDQEKLWPPIEQSIRTMANIKIASRDAVKNVLEPQEGSETDRVNEFSDPSLETDPFLAVKAASVLLLERGHALQSLADASGPLYGSLSSDQKGRLPILIRSFAPNNVKLRQFLALLTWDATVKKPESMLRRSDPSEQNEAGMGRRGWAQEDQPDGGIAMSRGEPQGRSGLHQPDLDGTEDEGEPGQMSDRMQARHGYGMTQARPYGGTPSSDADE